MTDYSAGEQVTGVGQRFTPEESAEISRLNREWEASLPEEDQKALLADLVACLRGDIPAWIGQRGEVSVESVFTQFSDESDVGDMTWLVLGALVTDGELVLTRGRLRVSR